MRHSVFFDYKTGNSHEHVFVTIYHYYRKYVYPLYCRLPARYIPYYASFFYRKGSIIL